MFSILVTVKTASPPQSPEVPRKNWTAGIMKGFPRKKDQRKKETIVERRNSSSAEDELKLHPRDHHGDHKGSPIHRKENGAPKMLGDVVGHELNSILPGTSPPSSDSGHDSGSSGPGHRIALRPPGGGGIGGGEGKRSKAPKTVREHKLDRKQSVEDIIDVNEPFPIPRSASSPTLDRKNKNPEQTAGNGEVSEKPMKPLPAKPGKPSHMGDGDAQDNSKEPLAKTKSLPFYKHNQNQVELLESPDGEKDMPTSPTGRGKDKRKEIMRPSVPPPAPPPNKVGSPAESPTTPSPRGSPFRTVANSHKPAKSVKPVIKGPKPTIMGPKPEITIPKAHPGNPGLKPSTDKRGSARRAGNSPGGGDSAPQGGKSQLLHMADSVYAQINKIMHGKDFSKQTMELCSNELNTFFKECTRHLESVSARQRFSLREMLNSLENNTKLLKVRSSSASSHQLQRIVKDLHGNVSDIRVLVQR